MDVLAEQRQDVATLKLSGRFDFDAHRAFKRAYEPCLAAADVREIRVDLGGLEHTANSVPGMLLVLRERGHALDKQVRLVNARGAVKDLLDTTNFGELFATL